MIKNYFIIAFRALKKNKLFSLINMLGLSIGISASLVIYLLVSYHFSFDQFEKDQARIYRVVSKFSFSGETYYNSGVTVPMGPAVKKELTGLDAVVPFRTMDASAKITVPDTTESAPRLFKNQGDIVFADENLLRLIGYQWLAGSPNAAFNQPYQTVLTASMAKRYFPNLPVSDMPGKKLVFNDTVTTTITGIVADLSQHSDFTFKIFISKITLQNTSLKPADWDQWDNTNGASQLLLKLSPGVSTAQIEKGIHNLYEKNQHKEPGDNSKTEHMLQPLANLHFDGNYGVYGGSIANKTVLFSLLGVALFLLLLGCINFINLTTAQASQRAKEIGVRKTMGGSRRQLFFQFISETSFLTLLATIVSVAATPLLLKAFAAFMPGDLHFSLIDQPAIWLFLLLLVIVVTILSDAYPALVLSSYKPVLVLKNQAYAGTGKTRQAWLRRTLTIAQFVIAQVFIMGTLLVSKQIHYTLNKDLGFRKDAIVSFNTNYFDTVANHKTVLLNKLRAIPEIAMVSIATAPPSSNSTWSSTVKYKDRKKEIESDVQFKYCDSNYIKLYGLQLLAGEGVKQSDTVNSFVINEAYANILGFQNPQQAIGKLLEWDNKRVPIAGVVANFHQKSLREPIKPLAMGSWSNSEKTISVLLQPRSADGNNWTAALHKMEKAWKEVYPEEDFNYSFFDEQIARYYNQEKDMASLMKWATGLAVLISCLGLLGLVMYSTSQRTKEIGVRKVLGASVMQILKLISKDFLLLVLGAFVIAVPIAWIGMNKWLENYAYRTSISWWLFVLAGILMVLTALMILSFQTIKAAIANPVESLRTE